MAYLAIPAQLSAILLAVLVQSLGVVLVVLAVVMTTGSIAVMGAHHMLVWLGKRHPVHVPGSRSRRG